MTIFFFFFFFWGGEGGGGLFCQQDYANAWICMEHISEESVLSPLIKILRSGSRSDQFILIYISLGHAHPYPPKGSYPGHWNMWTALTACSHGTLQSIFML